MFAHLVRSRFSSRGLPPLAPVTVPRIIPFQCLLGLARGSTRKSRIENTSSPVAGGRRARAAGAGRAGRGPPEAERARCETAGDGGERENSTRYKTPKKAPTKMGICRSWPLHSTRFQHSTHRYARKGTPMAMNSGKLHAGVAHRGAHAPDTAASTHNRIVPEVLRG